MRLVISLGGSLLTPPSPSTFAKYAKVLKTLKKKGHKLIVVCGGGKVCREYQRVAKKFKAANELLDWIGIQTTHLNALTLIAALGKDAYPHSLRTPQEVKRLFGRKILVCGGNLPGCSTDYDAALFAKVVKAKLLINATNIDGVYTADPKKYPKAKKLSKLSYSEFEKIILRIPQIPGEYKLFDLKAARIIKRNKIKLIIVDGRDPKEIMRAVEGKHKGSEIG